MFDDPVGVATAGAVLAGVTALLGTIFGFLLKWSKANRPDSSRKGKRSKSHSSGSPPISGAKPVQAPSPPPGLPPDLFAQQSRVVASYPRGADLLDTGEWRRVKDMTQVDWTAVEKNVRELAEKQRAETAVTQEQLRQELTESESRTGVRIDSLSSKVDRVEKKLDDHIRQNGNHAAGKYRHVTSR